MFFYDLFGQMDIIIIIIVQRSIDGLIHVLLYPLQDWLKFEELSEDSQEKGISACIVFQANILGG